MVSLVVNTASHLFHAVQEFRGCNLHESQRCYHSVNCGGNKDGKVMLKQAFFFFFFYCSLVYKDGQKYLDPEQRNITRSYVSADHLILPPLVSISRYHSFSALTGRLSSRLWPGSTICRDQCHPTNVTTGSSPKRSAQASQVLPHQATTEKPDLYALPSVCWSSVTIL